MARTKLSERQRKMVDFIRKFSLRSGYPPSIREIGVAAVPGSSFYSNPADGAQQVRFAFCKKPETLEEAGRRLRRLRNRL